MSQGKNRSEVWQRLEKSVPGNFLLRLVSSCLQSHISPNSTRSVRKLHRDLATVFRYIDNLDLPRIALSRQEIAAGSAVRSIPNPVKIELPDKTISGSVVDAEDENGDHRSVQVVSLHLKAPGYPVPTWIFACLILVMTPGLIPPIVYPCLGILLAAIFWKHPVGYHLVEGFLFLISLAATGLLLYQVPHSIQSGFNTKQVFLLIGFTKLFIFGWWFFTAWKGQSIRGYYLRETTPELIAYLHLTFWERIRLFFHPAGVTVLTCLICFLVFTIQVSRPGTLIVLKARAAAVLNSPLVAASIFESITAEDAMPSLETETASQLVRSISKYSRLGNTRSAYPLITKIPVYVDRLSNPDRKILARSIFSTAELLTRFGAPIEDWDRAATLNGFLLDLLPESDVAARAAERSEWRLVRIRQQQRVHQFTGYKVPVELREEMEESMIWHNASPGYNFLLLTTELAHLGRRSKELLHSAISLKTDDDTALPCRGFYENASLLKVKSFPGISPGPDRVTVTLVFEVPESGTDFFLKLGSREIVPILDTSPVKDVPGEGYFL